MDFRKFLEKFAEAHAGYAPPETIPPNVTATPMTPTDATQPESTIHPDAEPSEVKKHLKEMEQQARDRMKTALSETPVETPSPLKTPDNAPPTVTQAIESEHQGIAAALLKLRQIDERMAKIKSELKVLSQERQNHFNTVRKGTETITDILSQFQD